MINIRHLRAFSAVASELHFTKAAEVVCLTQPALSALIQQLESDLNTRLIHRHTRQVELTEVGKEFYETVKKLLHDFDQAIQDVQTYQSIKRGRVSIAALPILSSSVLPAILKLFRQTYPEIQLSVLDIHGHRITEAILNKSVDFGLTYFQQHRQEIKAESLMRDTLVLVCRKEAFPGCQSLRWRQLTGEPFIVMAQGTTIRTLIDSAVISQDIALDIVLEPQLMTTALAYVEAGLGITVLPSSGASRYLPETLRCVKLTDPEITRELSILTLKSYTLSPAAAALRSTILDGVKRGNTCHPADISVPDL